MHILQVLTVLATYHSSLDRGRQVSLALLGKIRPNGKMFSFPGAFVRLLGMMK